MTKISIVQTWPSAVPQIRAVPKDGFDLPHKTITPSEVVEALAKMEQVAPEGPEWWHDAVVKLRAELSADRIGAAMFMMWNMAATWGFKHGAFAGKNGEALGTHEARAPQRKGGGDHGGGRKPIVADAEELLKAYDTVSSQYSARKVVEKRRLAVKLLKKQGLHANATAIAVAISERRKRVGNR